MSLGIVILCVIILFIVVTYKLIKLRLISEQEKGFRALENMDIEESPRYFPDSQRMPDIDFWGLIQKSKDKFTDNFDLQIEYLIEVLSNYSNELIVGFEKTFREKVIELWNYNIKSLCQILYGRYLSMDVFLYFRFWIIANGKDYFYMALQHTDDLANRICKNNAGEGLIYVADNAFIRKNGKSTKLKLPSIEASKVDYDGGMYKMTGKYIELKKFKKRFPKLVSRFYKLSFF